MRHYLLDVTIDPVGDIDRGHPTRAPRGLVPAGPRPDLHDGVPVLGLLRQQLHHRRAALEHRPVRPTSEHAELVGEQPLVELGEPFLGTGTLKPGFRLPTGAVWQPALLLFGTFRTAVQSSDGGTGRITELSLSSRAVTSSPRESLESSGARPSLAIPGG